MKLWFENEYEEQPLDGLLSFDPEKTASEVAEAVLSAEHCPFDAEVSLTLTDDEGIREINSTMRGIDSPTDVLSFPMVAYEPPGDFSAASASPADAFDPDTHRLLLGDIVISADAVIRQAEEYGHSPKREFAFLVAHSMLHLAGYDHIDPDDEKTMIEKQESVLNALHITRDL